MADEKVFKVIVAIKVKGQSRAKVISWAWNVLSPILGDTLQWVSAEEIQSKGWISGFFSQVTGKE